MKHRFIQMALLVAAGVAAFSTVQSADAQGLPDMRVNIPFEFHTAGRTLPAGEYYLTVTNGYRHVDLRSQEGRTIFLSANPGERAVAGKSSLLFHRYGDRYFLHEIRSARQLFNGELPASKEEKSLTNVAGLDPVIETVSAGSR